MTEPQRADPFEHGDGEPCSDPWCADKAAGEDWTTNALGDILGQITELSEKVDKLEMLVTKVLDEIVPHIDSVAKGPIGKMLGLGK
jgi:hypothetical protein